MLCSSEEEDKGEQHEHWDKWKETKQESLIIKTNDRHMSRSIEKWKPPETWMESMTQEFPSISLSSLLQFFFSCPIKISVNDGNRKCLESSLCRCCLLQERKVFPFSTPQKGRLKKQIILFQSSPFVYLTLQSISLSRQDLTGRIRTHTNSVFRGRHLRNKRVEKETSPKKEENEWVSRRGQSNDVEDRKDVDL
jgi:hypothetical protein